MEQINPIRIIRPQTHQLPHITSLKPLQLSCKKIVFVVLITFATCFLGLLAIFYALYSHKLRKLLFYEQKLNEDESVKVYDAIDSNGQEILLSPNNVIRQRNTYIKFVDYNQYRYALINFTFSPVFFPHPGLELFEYDIQRYNNKIGLSPQRARTSKMIYGDALRLNYPFWSHLQNRLGFWTVTQIINIVLSVFTNYLIYSVGIFIISNLMIMILVYFNYSNQQSINSRYTIIRNQVQIQVDYQELVVGDLVVIKPNTRNRVINFRGILVKNRALVNQQAYSGIGDTVAKMPCTDFQRIQPRNIIYQTSIINIVQEQCYLVVLNHRVIGQYFYASLRKSSKFQKDIQKEYLIFSLSLLFIAIIATTLASFLIGFPLKITIINMSSLIFIVVPILFPICLIWIQIMSIIRLKRGCETIKILQSQRIKQGGIIEDIYISIPQTLLLQKIFTQFARCPAQVQYYDSAQRIRNDYAKFQEIKIFIYCLGAFNTITEQDIRNNRMPQIFRQLGFSIDKENPKKFLLSDFRDDFQILKKFQAAEEDQRRTVLIKNRQNQYFILTKGIFSNIFQEILNEEEEDQYYDGVGQKLQKQQYFVEYLCFKRYRGELNELLTLRRQQLQTKMSFAGFYCSQQTMNRYTKAMIKNLQEKGYDLKLFTKESQANSQFVRSHFQNLHTNGKIYYEQTSDNIYNHIKDTNKSTIMLGHGIYAQKGFYGANLAYLVSSNPNQSLVQSHFGGRIRNIQLLLAEGRSALIMTYITIKLVLLRQFCQALGQIYLLSIEQNMLVLDNLISDILFLIVPIMLMNLVPPKNLCKQKPNPRIFNYISVIEITLSFLFIAIASILVYLNRFNQSSKQMHLGRVAFTKNSFSGSNATLVNIVINGFSVAIVIILDKRQFWRESFQSIILSNIVRVYIICLWVLYHLHNKQFSQFNFFWLIDFLIVAVIVIDFFVDRIYQYAVQEIS